MVQTLQVYSQPHSWGERLKYDDDDDFKMTKKIIFSSFDTFSMDYAFLLQSPRPCFSLYVCKDFFLTCFCPFMTLESLQTNWNPWAENYETKIITKALWFKFQVKQILFLFRVFLYQYSSILRFFLPKELICCFVLFCPVTSSRTVWCSHLFCGGQGWGDAISSPLSLFFFPFFFFFFLLHSSLITLYSVPTSCLSVLIQAVFELGICGW